MSEDEQKLWNLDGKVVCGVKAEETDKQLHLLGLQESGKNLTVEQTALTVGKSIAVGRKHRCSETKQNSNNTALAKSGNNWIID